MIKSKLSTFILLISIALLSGCEDNDDTSAIPPDSGTEIPDTPLTDEELLDLVQRETFKYFWDYAEQNSGSARERYHPGNPSLDANVVATGGTGFGLMSLLVGMERNFVTRAQTVQRIEKILGFLNRLIAFTVPGRTGSTEPVAK